MKEKIVSVSVLTYEIFLSKNSAPHTSHTHPDRIFVSAVSIRKELPKKNLQIYFISENNGNCD